MRQLHLNIEKANFPYALRVENFKTEFFTSESIYYMINSVFLRRVKIIVSTNVIVNYLIFYGSEKMTNPGSPLRMYPSDIFPTTNLFFLSFD